MTYLRSIPARTWAALGFATAFIGCVVLANWMTTQWPSMPVGFGVTATAGTLAAGACLALRDGLQDTGGRLAVLLAIVVGAVLSLATSNPRFAVASAVAFLVSELLDAIIYTPLRKRSEVGDRRWAGAVTASNTVGTLADTAIFLGLAFGPGAILAGLGGQILGKAYPTIVFLLAGWGWRRRAVSRESDGLPASA
jgi:queuosine precursor transporter